MRYLLSISIGPVQDFIAAARRTADLAAGSEILVTIVTATAKAVSEYGHLIFPANVDNGGANKILIEVRDGVDPKTVASVARGAAQDCLWQEWMSVRPRIEQDYELNGDLADAQVKRFLEIYVAWTRFDGAGYARRRSEVEQLLAARKGLRDFSSPPGGIAPPAIYAKSPLDPALECVLKRMPELRGDGETEAEESARNPLHLKRTEFLDAISLLKREKRRRVPSTRDFAERRNRPGSHATSEDEDDTPPGYAYYAILQADGDDMGKRLDKMNTPDEHRDFSRKLAAFSESAGKIVKKHDGHLVYAGGDDVFAFLPVSTVIDCAREIADAFTATSGGTMSAGAAIVHYKQPLSISREQAKDAERAAKRNEGKNSLCLALHTRGGTPLFVTKKWGDWNTFAPHINAFEEEALPRGVAYELRHLAKEFDGLDTPSGLLAKEAERIWKRKQNESGRLIPNIPPDAASDCKSLRRFADELIAARFLTAKGGE